VSTGWTIFLVLLITWIAIMVYARKTKKLERFALSPYGPFLMWRTKRGKNLIEKVASLDTFWTGFGYFAIAFTFFAMILMTSLLLWIATLIPSVPHTSIPSFRLILGIPGVNPAIPIWQGILGLLVGIGVHEFAHGILTRVHRLKLLSLGLLFAWVPMGAFAEPDEQDLRRAKKRARMSVYAVGPTSNFILAAVTVFLFASVMMGSLAPVYDAPVCINEGQFSWGEQLISINGTELRTPNDVDSLHLIPGQNYTATTFKDGTLLKRNVTAGLFVIDVFLKSPADDANLTKGIIILKVANTTIWNQKDFSDTLENFQPGDTVNLLIHSTTDWSAFNVNVTLADRYEYYKTHYPAYADERDRGEAFVGVFISYMGGPFTDAYHLRDIYVHPYKYNDIIRGSLAYVGMPLQKLSPVPEPVKNIYEPSGVLSVLPEVLFYILADGLYWIFWISIMLGLTNALPAFPLDGGVLLSDALGYVLKKALPKITEDMRTKIVDRMVITSSLTVVALVLWQFLGPRLLSFF